MRTSDTTQDRAGALLRAARRQLRSRTRKPSYFARADRFAQVYLGGPIGVSSEVCGAVGTDLAAALDSCYEQESSHGLASRGALRSFSAWVEELLSPARAAPQIGEIIEDLEAPDCPLTRVAGGIVAAIGTLGHASLQGRGSAAPLADGWAALWREAVSRHNDQQRLSCDLTGCLRAQDTPGVQRTELDASPRGGTFEDGVLQYLAELADTSAATMALVAALPFSDALSDGDVSVAIRFLTRATELRRAMNEHLRFALDVRFDPSESINAGAFGIAAERILRVGAPLSDKPPAVRVEARLRQLWDRWSPGNHDRMMGALAGLEHEPIVCSRLGQVITALHSVAHAMAAQDSAGC